MNNEKKFLSRIARRKDSTPAKPDEGHEIPPPSAIEPGVPYSAEDTEGKDYGSHMELELLAADEPSRTDSTNGVDARESAPAPVLESLTAPVSGEPPDATGTPREAAPFEEYGLDLEPLTEAEADESPDEAETSGQDGEAFSAAAESVKEATAAEPEIPGESEPEAVAEIAREVEEPTAASDVVETRDAPVPQSEAALYEEYDLDLESLSETESEAALEDTEPSLQEPPLEDEAAASEAVESVMEASASESEVPQETEPEAVDEMVQGVEESPVASISQESPDEDELLIENEKPAPDVVETRDAPVPQSEAALYEEYDLELESLNETESEAAPEDAEPSLQEPPLEDEAAASEAVESVMEASASESEVPQETEPEAVDEMVQGVEESPVASISQESPDESAPTQPEPSQEDEVTSHIEILEESPPEQMDEPSEASPVENGFLPLVRDSRGNWRPGKGFSRSELHEAGLSPAEAARLGVRVDKRRRNAHPVNVAALERAKSGV